MRKSRLAAGRTYQSLSPLSASRHSLFRSVFIPGSANSTHASRSSVQDCSPTRNKRVPNHDGEKGNGGNANERQDDRERIKHFGVSRHRGRWSSYKLSDEGHIGSNFKAGHRDFLNQP
jgi:hypothetical protein